MKTIKIADGIEIPIPEYMKDGWWNVSAEWRHGKLTKVEYKRMGETNQCDGAELFLHTHEEKNDRDN